MSPVLDAPPRALARRAGRVVALVVALAGPLAVAACRAASTEARGLPAPPPGEVWLGATSPKLAALTIDTVRVRDARTIAVLPAQVVASEDHTVRVLSPVTGRVRALLVAPGDRVAAGQPLARIASGDYAQATSDVARATAALDAAEAALERAEDLYAHHVIAMRELEQGRADAAQARAEAMRARARAEQLGAGAGGGEFVLRAPIAGSVLERAANPGMEVRPDVATPLFVISALDHVWVTASVYQRDLPHVRAGARFVFTTDAAPGRTFEGRVSYVSAALDPQTRTATARAVLANADGALRPELMGEARLLASDSSGTPVVASRALVTHGSDIVVWVETVRGRFARRVVTVGDDDGTWASITSGLAPGERIVTDGSLLLDAEANRIG